MEVDVQDISSNFEYIYIGYSTKTFHTMLHIISTNNYLKNYNQICTAQSTFCFENKLFHIIIQTNKGVWMQQ
jgi:hypothetical protein